MARQAADYFSGITSGLWPALGASVLLHLGILFGVQLTPHAQAHAPRALEARLQAQSATATEVGRAADAALQPRRIIATQSPGARIADPLPVAVANPSELPMPHIEEARNEPVSATASEPDYYEAGLVDAPPHILGEVQQIYPARARAREVEGSVTLALVISESGTVDDISVVQAQPQGYFEEAALTMLRKQRFSPAIKQGRAVRSRWLTTVRYRLQG